VQLADVLARYSTFAIGLGVDLAAILLMTYVLYFRRHCARTSCCPPSR
jgi:hypothetical protein